MKFKRISKVTIAILCALTVLTGCFSTKENAIPFDDYIASLPTRLMPNDSLNLEFMFEDPTTFGFTKEILNLPYSNLEDYQDTEKETKLLLEELGTYTYSDLSESQKVTYDILKDYLTRNLGADAFYYLDNSYLGSFVGFQAQLPLLLYSYTFETENDINSYFHILKTAEEVFVKYADIEKERQANDSGMSKAILNKVIEQTENFIKDENPFLVEAMNKKIDEVDFLSEEQKAEAKEKNTTLVKNDFINAYRTLGEELKQINASDEEVGLAGQPKGKDYYEYLLRKTTGLDDSVEEIRTYLEKRMMSASMEMLQLKSKHPEVYEKVLNMDLSTVKYTNMKSIEEVIDYLGEQLKKDYPDVGTLNYTVTTVPESMKDNFSPAAYLQGKIDAPKDAPEQIWINGEFKQGLFETLAHEGYPGHMYQHTYFKQQNLPIIHHMIDYNGYSEGWATYIEGKSWEYADVSDEEKVILEFLSLNTEVTQAMIGLLDINIHYDGFTYEQYKKEIGQYMSSLDEETLKKQWYLILETPTNYLQYYVTGMKYSDLFDEAKKQLGNKFDRIKFNETLLKYGPAPYAFLEKQVQAYIEAMK